MALGNGTDRNWLELFARLGYGSRGLVYVIIGFLAVLAAFGRGGEAEGSKGALAALFAQPLGGVVLGIVALGLLGFALWRFIEAGSDADRLGRDPKGLLRRAAQVISGCVNLALAYFALSLLMGWATGGTDDDRSARDWTAWAMSKPFGIWAVGIVGLILVAAGIAVAWKGWKAKFTRTLSCGHDTRRWLVPLGRAGFIARGVVFALAGLFLIVAAYQSDPSEAHGLGGSLEALQEQPYGWALFGLVAIGLLAFGLFGLAQARYQHIDAPDPGAAVEGIASRLS